jgi:putative endonuclease
MISTYKFGIFAEFFISFIYLIKFYKPLERRYRNYFGEIDLIFARGKNLYFVEVKARRSYEEEVLTNRQLQRIKKAASYFIACHPEFTNFNVRFDLAIVRPWFKSTIIKNI